VLSCEVIVIMASGGNGEPEVSPVEDTNSDGSLSRRVERIVEDNNRLRQEIGADLFPEFREIEPRSANRSRTYVNLVERRTDETINAVTGSDLWSSAESNPLMEHLPAEAATGRVASWQDAMRTSNLVAAEAGCVLRSEEGQRRLTTLGEEERTTGQFDFGGLDIPFKSPAMPTLYPVGYTPMTGRQQPDPIGGKERLPRVREPINDDDDDGESINSSACTFVSHQSHASRKGLKKLRDNSNLIAQMMAQTHELARLDHASRDEQARLAMREREIAAERQHAEVAQARKEAEQMRREYEHSRQEAEAREREMHEQKFAMIESQLLEKQKREEALQQQLADARAEAERASHDRLEFPRVGLHSNDKHDVSRKRVFDNDDVEDSGQAQMSYVTPTMHKSYVKQLGYSEGYSVGDKGFLKNLPFGEMDRAEHPPDTSPSEGAYRSRYERDFLASGESRYRSSDTPTASRLGSGSACRPSQANIGCAISSVAPLKASSSATPLVGAQSFSSVGCATSSIAPLVGSAMPLLGAQGLTFDCAISSVAPLKASSSATPLLGAQSLTSGCATSSAAPLVDEAQVLRRVLGELISAVSGSRVDASPVFVSAGAPPGPFVPSGGTPTFALPTSGYLYAPYCDSRPISTPFVGPSVTSLGRAPIVSVGSALLLPLDTTVSATVRPVVEQQNLNVHKLRPYTGAEPMKSFLLNYNSVAKLNRWDEAHRFLALQACLQDTAASVMWTSAKVPTSAEELLEALTDRFGSEKFLEGHRQALNAIRKENKESTPAYYNRVLTMMAAAYPGQHGAMYEATSKQVYIAGWPSPNLRASLKLADCATVYETHIYAMRIEASGCTPQFVEHASTFDDVGNVKRDKVAKVSQARARSPSPKSDSAVSSFDMKMVNQSINDTVHKVMSAQFKSFNNNRGYVGPSNGTTDKGQQVANASAGNDDDDRPRYRKTYPPRDQEYVRKCWNCGDASHVSFRCPKPLTEECKERQRQALQRQQSRTEPEVQSVAATTPKTAPVVKTNRMGNSFSTREATIEINVAGNKYACLLDSGSGYSLAPRSVLGNAVILPTSVTMAAANGTGIKILGQVELCFKIQDKLFAADFLVSDDVDMIMLGLDWLSENGVFWDFSRKVIKLGKLEITMVSPKREENTAKPEDLVQASSVAKIVSFGFNEDWYDSESEYQDSCASREEEEEKDVPEYDPNYDSDGVLLSSRTEPKSLACNAIFVVSNTQTLDLVQPSLPDTSSRPDLASSTLYRSVALKDDDGVEFVRDSRTGNQRIELENDDVEVARDTRSKIQSAVLEDGDDDPHLISDNNECVTIETIDDTVHDFDTKLDDFDTEMLFNVENTVKPKCFTDCCSPDDLESIKRGRVRSDSGRCSAARYYGSSGGPTVISGEAHNPSIGLNHAARGAFGHVKSLLCPGSWMWNVWCCVLSVLLIVCVACMVTRIGIQQSSVQQNWLAKERKCFRYDATIALNYGCIDKAVLSDTVLIMQPDDFDSPQRRFKFKLEIVAREKTVQGPPVITRAPLKSLLELRKRGSQATGGVTVSEAGAVVKQYVDVTQPILKAEVKVSSSQACSIEQFDTGQLVLEQRALSASFNIKEACIVVMRCCLRLLFHGVIELEDTATVAGVQAKIANRLGGEGSGLKTVRGNFGEENVFPEINRVRLMNDTECCSATVSRYMSFELPRVFH
jgi:hypothetical protein